MALTKLEDVKGQGKARKALRSGQRARVRARKARAVTTFTEAADVEARANKILGQDVWRLRGIVSAKILYLFTSAEKVTGWPMVAAEGTSAVMLGAAAGWTPKTNRSK